MSSLLIKNGRLIDPRHQIDRITDLEIIDGCVARIGDDLTSGGPTLDASGLIVTPGLIDPHVHLREPGQEEKETIASGAAAAINGGFTSICCMPNTSPALDDDGRIKFVHRRAQEADLCHVFAAGAVTKGRKGEELAEIGLMHRAGAVAFTDDGDAIASASAMSKALTYVKMTGRVLMQHCEEPTLITGGVMNAGALATRLGLGGRPAIAEELIIQRDILLNRPIGCRYHVQHLSTAGGVELIRRARSTGQPVTGEVAPHHLLLTEEACRSYDPNYKMNPPLRTQADIQAIIAGVVDGTITILATDHAPHTSEEKSHEFAASPSGIIGLDCALPLYAKALIEPGHLDWPAMLKMMTDAPADLLGLDSKGHLAVGADGDVTLIDPEAVWKIDSADFASKSRNCPFHGWSVRSRAEVTIVAGRIKLNRLPDRLNQ